MIGAPQSGEGSARVATNDALLRVAAALAAELELDRLVQIITDEATALCRAAFGAFFYNMIDTRGKSYVLYTLSGVPRDTFASFPMPRNTAVFAPTFHGEGVVRSDDITMDPRYGGNAPYHGMPAGHLPVRSYLAVPVVSRSREVLGGLFFGHPERGVFTAADEEAVLALAVHASIAIDNARLYLAAKSAEAAERRARAEAERARQSLATTLRSIGDAVIATDAEGVITFMNPVAEELTGWTEGEAHGMPLHEVFRIINELTRKIIESPVDRVIREGTVVGLTNHTVLLRRDGTEIAIDDSGAPIRDAEGALSGIVLVFRDVTEKKRESSKRELFAEVSEVLASSLDVERTLAGVARALVPRLADWCAIDMVGDRVGSLRRVTIAHLKGRKVTLVEELSARTPPDNAAQRVVLRTGKAELYPELTDEILATIATDHEHMRVLRELELRSAMLVPLLARGRTLGVISLGHAESDRRYTPGDLELAGEVARRVAVAVDNAMLFASEQKARDAADQANRTKDDFLATVSHELRTPLNAMLGWTRMLRAGTLPETRRERALETIERNAVTQAQLIEDLLDISRIISGKMRLEVQSVELLRIVEQALDSLRLASESREIRIVAELDQDAGPLLGDPNRLQQVVWNLLNNAIKFTQKGGRIRISLERVDASVTLTVADNGRGISPRFLPFVFERFKQADPGISRAHGGLGLGLAISRHIVELHGGAIEAHSEGEGHGATFVVRLPVAPARPEAPALPSRLAAVPSAVGFERPPELLDLRILVVDDELDARDLLTAVLESCGAVVMRADAATTALTVLERELPDIIISDIGMPGEDGYTFIRKVRALPPERGGRIPAAALTAYARAEDRRRALNAGYMMHIPKPVEPAELVAVIANLARFSLGRGG
jgi:PAS domain S-box-containing protein